MLKTLFLIFSIGTFSLVFTQTNDKTTQEIPVIVATYKGGQEAMNKHFSRSLKLPKDSTKETGTVYVEFWIDHEGNVSDVKILKGINPTTDEKVKKSVETMPAWNPAKDPTGKPMKSKMVLPVKLAVK